MSAARERRCAARCGSRAGRALALALACALAVLAGCGPAGSTRPRSLVLVTLDTARADALDGGAASQKLAPRIAALAHEGLRFPRAYTVAPLTLPAHASLLTGLTPPRHGLRDNGRDALSGEARTLAEELASHGLETAAFVSSLVLDRSFGLAQGFEVYDQPALVARPESGGHSIRRAIETARQAVGWLEARRSRAPFFLWAHFYDAHLPYEPDAAHLARAGGDPYRGEIAELDDAVGFLLDGLAELGLDAETLVVVTADHGESLGEHGEPAHGALCYEAAVRVPLIFRFPGPPPVPGPQRLASLVDLLPTLLGRLGFEAPPDLDGIDLFQPAGPLARGVYFESYSGYLNYGWSPLAGWLDVEGKYLHSATPEFYAVLQDPHETRDLVDARPEECARARQHLAELLARPVLPVVRGDGDGGDAAALARALSVLGYARGQREDELPSPLDPSNLPSPAQRADELEPLLVAHALFESGRHAEAAPLLAELVAKNPRHRLALELYATSLMYLHEFAAAEAILRQRLELGETADARLNLGLSLLEQDQPEPALREIEAALALLPERPEILAARQRALQALARSPP